MPTQSRSDKASGLIESFFAALTSSRLDHARELLLDAKAAATQDEDNEALWWIGAFRAYVPLYEGDYESALEICRERLDTSTRLGYQWKRALALRELAGVLLAMDHVGEALRAAEESVVIIDTMGPRLHAEGSTVTDDNRALKIADLKTTLGRIRHELGDRAGAISDLRDAIQRFAALDYDHWLLAQAFENLAATLVESGDTPNAARLWGAAEALRELVGYPIAPPDQPPYRRRVGVGRNLVPGRTWETWCSEGKSLTPKQGIELALGSSSRKTPRTAPAPTSR